MILWTCPARTRAGALPLVGGLLPQVGHPCGRAAKALDDAGHSYEVRVAGGFKALPWTRRGERDHIRELTGQEDVPVLVLDDGTAIAGTGRIVDWAAAHPAGAPARA